ncbi:hypothetical protein ASE21_19910 [Flavobacterium sp. Root901]|uniref:hypothetical protein n=1 Tax=Flavobacterium sp. Root901 TaxID=1736605 RepID=UPI000710D83A|nr:hypothetical protein [Flavobacterium sp. Root901]KRD06428.1 hypothetical protein ASE21_19910 [Flavobacterium sp. Root901]
MKRNLIHRIPILLLLSGLFFSCASDLDFDQINDFKIEPVLVANLAYFDISANQIDDSGQGQQIPPDVEEFDVFKNKFFTDHLIKAELNFEIENTVNRAFEIELQLLDINNQVLETINLDVPKYTGGSNIIKYPAEVFDGERLNLLKNTMKIGFVVRTVTGSGSNPLSGNLKLKSGATVYMRVE